MLNKERIYRTETFLRQKFDSSAYYADKQKAKDYRIEHTYRVANIGRHIALKEGFDESEMIIACLLHDVSYSESFGDDGWINHGRRSASIARPFLKELGIAEDRINDICYGIAIHVDDSADFPGERTPFALTVGEADNIDRFDAYRIHETLSYKGFLDMSFNEKLEFARGQLTRVRELSKTTLSTATADEMWKSRLSLNISFFERLVDQLEHSKEIRN